MFSFTLAKKEMFSFTDVLEYYNIQKMTKRELTAEQFETGMVSGWPAFLDMPHTPFFFCLVLCTCTFRPTPQP
jgi:hypothetical protein